jgi:hypothetical protein
MYHSGALGYGLVRRPGRRDTGTGSSQNDLVGANFAFVGNVLCPKCNKSPDFLSRLPPSLGRGSRLLAVIVRE